MLFYCLHEQAGKDNKKNNIGGYRTVNYGNRFYT